jgi:hypothetical protein
MIDFVCCCALYFSCVSCVVSGFTDHGEVTVLSYLPIILTALKRWRTAFNCGAVYDGGRQQFARAFGNGCDSTSLSSFPTGGPAKACSFLLKRTTTSTRLSHLLVPLDYRILLFGLYTGVAASIGFQLRARIRTSTLPRRAPAHPRTLYLS